MNEPAGAPKPKYNLPIAALVTSILGLCLCPLSLVGIVLGIVSLVRIGREPHLPGKGLAIAALILPVAMVPIIGILSAIAIPNFIRFQSRAKQAECRANLKSAFTAEQAFHAERGTYSTDVAELGFSPERGNRYAYVLDPNGKILMSGSRGTGAQGSIIAADSERFPQIQNDELLAGLSPVLAGGVKLGTTGACPDCSITLACVGNIDTDSVLDVWSISTEDRTDERGSPIPAGTLHNDVNDVNM